jgi:hypothetical protein
MASVTVLVLVEVVVGCFAWLDAAGIPSDAEASGECAFVVGEVGGVDPARAHVAVMIAAPHEELLAVVEVIAQVADADAIVILEVSEGDGLKGVVCSGVRRWGGL